MPSMFKGKSKAKPKVSKKIKKEVKMEINKMLKKAEEYKQYVGTASATAVYDGAGSIITHLTPITQGATDSERVGDKLNVKSLQIRLTMYNGSGASSNVYTNFRVFVFQYKDEDNTPAINQIFLSSNANGGATQGTMSARHIDFLTIYTKLYDKHFHVEGGRADANNFSPTGQLSKTVFINVPMKYVQKKLSYQAGSPNCNNGIWLLITTDQATATINPLVSYDWNVRYTDA